MFYGIGAYACAYLTVDAGLSERRSDSLSALAISVALALVVGWPMLRLTGYFLALATLAMSVIAHARCSSNGTG